MIQGLQKKLTLAAVCALILIFALTVAAINAASALSLKAQISQSLEMLVGNSASSTGQADDSAAGRRERSGLPAVRASALSRVTESCVIRLTKTGELYEWKTESGDLYDDALVSSLAESIRTSGRSEGRIGAQAYRMEPRKYGALIVAMDVSPEIGYLRTLLRITAIAGAASCALLSALAALLIRRALRPVQEAFDKQRQFVWDASHELKTPLAVLSANAQVLEKELGQNEYFGYIRTEVSHMSDLVQSLLTLARLDAGRQAAPMERFDLGEALLTLALPLEGLAFEMGKTLQTDVPENVFCMGSKSMLMQLVSVLLSNALKYSDPGGTITLSLEAKGRQRLVRVHNTGSYISPEEQKKIFDRFYRAENAAGAEGSGIGLAIAKSIAQLHHGTILVDSRQESGTCFTLVLSERS